MPFLSPFSSPYPRQKEKPEQNPMATMLSEIVMSEHWSMMNEAFKIKDEAQPYAERMSRHQIPEQ